MLSGGENVVKFDLDPTPRKVLLIALLSFIEILLGGILTQLATGQMPTKIQWMIIFCTAGLQLVIYLSEFLKAEEETKT